MARTVTISELDLIRLRHRALSTTDLAVVIADATRADTPLVDVNPSFERITGYPSVAVIGRNPRFLQGPGTDPDAVRRMGTAIAEAKPLTEVLLNYRYDGTPFWNEVTVSPVYDQNGILTHFVGLQHDVTERERANLRLQILADASDLLGHGDASEDIFNAISRIMAPRYADYCTVHRLSEEGIISWVSTSGADASVVEAIEHFERSLPHQPDDDSGVAAVIRTGVPILRQDPSDGVLSETARNDEHRRLLQQHEWRATMIVPIKAFDHVFGTMHLSQVKYGFPFTAADFDMVQDVGNRIGSMLETLRLMHHARSALAERERFLSVAAHELRTPVASIKGYAQLLSRSIDRGTLTPERLRHAIDTLDASVARLSGLTNDLLDMSRQGSQDLPLRIDHIHLASFLGSVASRSGLLYDHPIVVDVDSGDGHFLGDVAKIDQVMSNLVSNAAKYSASDQPITIQAQSGNDGVRITVRDVGIGLSQEDLETIFELFGRSSRPEAANVPGLGLGLFISRNIVERHGGKLWAESAGRGRGSSVHIWLPTTSTLPSPRE
jgi:PAS domain S-box-containing protein